jgi:glycogen synthase
VRVAFATDGVFPHALGGIQRHTSFLATALVRQGVEVDVIAPAGHASADQEFRVVELPWPRTPVYPLTLRRWAAQVAPAVASTGYDVVYGQGLNLWGLLPTGAPPAVFNPHGLEMCTVSRPLERAKGWPLRFAARREAAQAQRVLSLGGRLTETAIHCLGVPADRVTVVPNGVDLAYFDRGEESQRTPGLVLFVGRLFPNKGVDLLLRAFQVVSDPGATLAIVGDGPLRRELEAGSSDARVRFLGAVAEDDLIDLYRRAEFVCVPSRYDGMPTVILEAFACGTPALGSDVGAIAELIDDETGLLVPPEDVDALARALETMLGWTAERRSAAQLAARARAVERFSWDAVAARTRSVLEDVVASGRRS